LQVGFRDVGGGFIEGVGARCGGVENAQGVAGGIDGLAEVAGALRDDGNRAQVGAADLFADAFVADREEGAAGAVVEFGDDEGAGDVEAELIAAEDVLVASALADVMGRGVEEVVAQVVGEPAVVGDRCGFRPSAATGARPAAGPDCGTEP
jgi:hypothetical protein